VTRTDTTGLAWGRHSTDMVSLISGALFLGVAGAWALDRADLLGGLRGWLLPLLLIAVGVIGLIGIRPRRQAARTHDAAAEGGTADERS